MKSNNVYFIFCLVLILLLFTIINYYNKKENFSSENKYYTSDCDIKTEGFGVQYFVMMVCITYCEYNNSIYVHSPFQDMGHLENQDKISYLNKLNEFIGINNDHLINSGLTNDDLINNKENIYKKLFDDHHFNMNTHFTNTVIKKIRDYYYSTSKPNIDNIDIAIHIRRGDIGNGHENYLENNVYVNIINFLKIKYPEYKITIFSEGNIDHFKDFGLKEDNFKLNLDIMETFHSSKILIMSRSYFSFSSAILNENIVYYIPMSNENIVYNVKFDKWLNIYNLMIIPPT